MAESRKSIAYHCGQLYAALQVLCSIGAQSNKLAEVSVLSRATQSPRNELRKHLQRAGEHLVDAVQRGPDHGRAASEVFQAIPTFLPPGGLPSAGFGNSQSADFSSGYTDQLCVYKDRHGRVMAM